MSVNASPPALRSASIDATPVPAAEMAEVPLTTIFLKILFIGIIPER
jgi:hypothetical protein